MPFGSYALGAHLKESDMDLVCFAPWQLQRHDVFNGMAQQLRQVDSVSGLEVSYLLQKVASHTKVVERAPVPIIKFIYDEAMPVDISFARIHVLSLTPMVNILDDQVLDGIEDVDCRSLDGPRVHQFIESKLAVDDKPAFCAALRCIKHWAMRRGIYGKPMGYLNGGTWALLLCKTYMENHAAGCQINSLLYAFFYQWSKWSWPKPVLLDKLHDLHGSSTTFNELMEFQQDIMPILTPCYPYKSSNPYATHSTVKVITRELIRASNIMNAYIRIEQESLIPKLFKPFSFPRQYKHYMNIVLCSDHVSKRQDRFKGKLAACIPKLVQLVEQHPRITLAHPWTVARTSVYNYSTLEEKANMRRGIFVNDPRSYYMSGELNPGELYRLDYYVALELAPETPTSRYNDNVVDLSSAINTFVQETREKILLRDPSASLAVTSVKRWVNLCTNAGTRLELNLLC
ncbi:hypothetical protein NQZ79_g5268 [Umbelopsis isabellina]|nr:hypothetical protein NQZ79_g5268 [Umbelopsis isabellina]